jgi:hypothetical protein
VTFIDTSIFMYAAGRPGPEQQACSHYLLGLSDGQIGPHAINAELLQEVMHRYRSIARLEDARDVLSRVLALPIAVFPVHESTIRLAWAQIESHPRLSTRDAVHVATMQEVGMTEIVSYDSDFDVVPWITRMTPPAPVG